MQYKVQFIKISNLKPYKNNAKKHNEQQIEQIANSLKQFGFRQNLVIDKNNVIVVGHGRFEAAKKLGLDVVPCIKAEDLSDEQIKALRLADNKLNESEWNFDLVDKELENIFDIDMSDFGFEKILQDNEKPSIKTVKLQPYRKVHYLISLDINDNDKVADIIYQLRNMGGIEVESTLN